MMKMSVVATRFSNDESARPPTQLKLDTQSDTDIFIDQVHKFQNSYFNPIQNNWGEGVKKVPPYQFSAVTSTNVRVSPHFLTFNFDPFVTLV